MKRPSVKRLSLVILAAVALFGAGARAQEFGPPGGGRPDDRVMFDVSAEDWVTTKTAHVTIAVEAAVTANTADTMRAGMAQAVNDLAKGDWRLTSFNRNEDQAGMERWSALFEARLPENDLGGLGDAAKKLSKAGLQLSVAGIDFSPTLEEMEAARSGLRARIYKIASDQLNELNAALPGRNYRIALVNFAGDDGMVPMPRVVKGYAEMDRIQQVAPMAISSPPPLPPSPVERSEKISLTARIVLAAAPEESKPLPPPAPAPAPAATKH